MSIDRRHVLVLGASVALFGLRPAQAVEMSRVTAYAFGFESLAGGHLSLASYAGRPVLVVNTASLCGYTPQYAGLQALWTRFGPRGLVVLGVPSNDFGRQEPGGAGDIGRTVNDYHVTFPLAAKATVKGKDAHPFYKWAARIRPLDAPRWNFHKYLIGRDGTLRASFTSTVEPTDPRVIAAIEKEIAGE